MVATADSKSAASKACRFESDPGYQFNLFVTRAQVNIAMKKFIALIACFFINIASAQQCVMVVPFAPGGSSDIYARIIQKYNPNIRVEYRPGAFAANGVQALETNHSWFMITTPALFSAANPNRDPSVELMQIMFPLDASIVTGNNTTLEDLSNKKINFGIPILGQIHHITALIMKERNPQLEIIPMGNDGPKAFTALLNKDIDVMTSSLPNAHEWVRKFPGQLRVLADIPFNRGFTYNGVRIENLNFFGMFVSRDASAEQKQAAVDCVNRAAQDPGHDEDFRRIGIQPNRIQGAEKNRLLAEHIKLLRKHGL